MHGAKYLGEVSGCGSENQMENYSPVRRLGSQVKADLVYFRWLIRLALSQVHSRIICLHLL